VAADEAMAQVVQGDQWRTDLLPEPTRKALDFLEKLNARPGEIGPQDVQALRDAGLSDDAIRDAIYVCTIFNVIDRLADAFGFDIPPPGEVRGSARFLIKYGYQ
jgi:alkylhydroperoxidase family enzyme